MAKGKKTGGRDFQLGHTFSKGRRGMKADEKAIKKAMEAHFWQLCELLLRSESEFNDYVNSPDCSMLGKMLKKSFDGGAQISWREVIEQCVGKLPEKFDVTSNSNVVDTSVLSKEQKKKIGEAFLKKINGEK